MSSDEVAALKQAHHATWAAGDYAAVAEKIQDVADQLVARAEVGPGMEVLDVATGSGNVAIAAARTGARVTGLDLTPELFEAGRRRAADAGVEVRWVEGDAEALPFEDESFDRVLSTFRVMFAPRHEVAAAELVRVCRPGGVIGLCNWTPEGMIGDFFRTVGSHMPPPPDFASPPPLWGSEDHVRSLLGGAGLELELEPGAASMRWESPDACVTFYEETFGPIVMAKQALSADGRWDGLRADLLDWAERHNSAGDGSMLVEPEYLRAVARKPG